MIKTLRAVCKFLAIVLKSLYTRILSNPLDNPTFNHKSGSRSVRVEGSSPYLSFNWFLYISWKEKKIHQIQGNNNLRKKKVENKYTAKCWVQLFTNCCTIFWRSPLHIYVSIKSFIGLESHLRTIACKIKILSIKYIYKKQIKKWI
jgi:hypothetical protein